MDTLALLLEDPQYILPLFGLSAVIGYWFRSVWNYTRFSMIRESGYHLFYNSLVFGFFTLSALWLLHAVLFALVPIINTGEVSIFITIVFGLFLPFLLNSFLFNDKHKYLKRTMESHGDSLYLIVFEAYKNKRYIELTLKNGKIFIGSLSKPLNYRYKYVDIVPHDSPHQIAIKAEEVLIVRQVERQNSEQVKPSN